MTPGGSNDWHSRLPYSALARAYASGAERNFSIAMAHFALEQAGAAVRNYRSVLDVCCGIGAACEVFADVGLVTNGVDASSDMLSIARAAAQDRGLPIVYSQADMRAIAVAAPVDLVTCMYDSVNYMSNLQDLLSAFQAARRVLRADGMYVFDMYTVRGLAERSKRRDTVHTDNDRHFVVSRTIWDRASSTATKSFWGFDRCGEHWVAWRERHTERAYEVDDVVAVLLRAGLRVQAVHGWDAGGLVPLDAGTGRAVFVTRALDA